MCKEIRKVQHEDICPGLKCNWKIQKVSLTFLEMRSSVYDRICVKRRSGATYVTVEVVYVHTVN